MLDNTRPLLRRLDPFLRNLTPIVDYLGLYKREIAAFFANDARGHAAAGAERREPAPVHYLRATNPLNPEIMAGYPNRLATNRSNPYTEPGALRPAHHGQPLPVFGSYLCTTTPAPTPPAPNENMAQRLSDADQALRLGIGTATRAPGAALRRAGAAGPAVGQPGATRTRTAALSAVAKQRAVPAAPAARLPKLTA